MKICYIANAGSIHTQRWVEYFADRGHDVHLISPRPFGNSSIENVKLYILKTFRPQIRIMSFPINLPFYAIQVRILVARIKPDILHAHYVADCGSWGALSGFHPFILSAWGSDVLAKPKESAVNKLIVGYALRKADVATTTSQYLQGYLQTKFRMPEHRVMAIPWGNDLKIFHKGYDTEVKELRSNLGIDENNFVALSPRHLTERYRIEYIVQAISYVVIRYPNIVLLLLKGMAEDREYENRINNLANELGVTQNIRLIRKELKPKEMAVIDNVSDVIISIPRSDQFSACIQEGMACGVIPMVGNLEVYKQYLVDGENALFVNPEDPKDIAQKVIYCIEHPELKQRYYEINRKIIEEKEDWDKNARKMEQIYNNLIREPEKEAE